MKYNLIMIISCLVYSLTYILILLLPQLKIKNKSKAVQVHIKKGNTGKVLAVNLSCLIFAVPLILFTGFVRSIENTILFYLLFMVLFAPNIVFIFCSRKTGFYLNYFYDGFSTIEYSEVFNLKQDIENSQNIIIQIAGKKEYIGVFKTNDYGKNIGKIKELMYGKSV